LGAAKVYIADAFYKFETELDGSVSLVVFGFLPLTFSFRP